MTITDKFDKKTLAENFLNYFSVQIADTPQLRKQAYRIRYRTYCEEFGYEDSTCFLDGMEYDEYDDDALHFLITHRSGIPAACVRIISTKKEEEPLPFEKHCGEAIERQLVKMLAPDRSKMCEISRLTVDKTFRRHKEIAEIEAKREERRTFPFIAIAAFFGATAITELSGRTKVFAMMEAFLPRLMKRSGIMFEKVGRDIAYHGIRAPHFIHTQHAIDNMKPELRGLYEGIYAQLSVHFKKIVS